MESDSGRLGPGFFTGRGPLRFIPVVGCISIRFRWMAEWYPNVEMLHCLSARLPRTCEWLLILAITSRRLSGSWAGFVRMHVSVSPGQLQELSWLQLSPLVEWRLCLQPLAYRLQPGPPNPGVRNNLVRKSLLAPPPVALTQASPEMTPISVGQILQ